MKDERFFSGLIKIVKKEKCEAIDYYNITQNNTFGRFVKILSSLESKIENKLFNFNEEEQHLISELLEMALDKGSITAMEHYELTFDELFKVDEAFLEAYQHQNAMQF